MGKIKGPSNECLFHGEHREPTLWKKMAKTLCILGVVLIPDLPFILGAVRGYERGSVVAGVKQGLLLFGPLAGAAIFVVFVASALDRGRERRLQNAWQRSKYPWSL